MARYRMVLWQREVKRCIITKARSGGCRLKNLPQNLYYFFISKEELVIVLCLMSQVVYTVLQVIYILHMSYCFTLSSVIHESFKVKVSVLLCSLKS